MTPVFALSPHFGANSAALAACGGALLGASVIFKTLLTGRVLGVSGATRGLLQDPCSIDRAAFLLGLVAAGPAMAAAYGGFEPVPAQTAPGAVRWPTFLRLLLGGFLVGLGSCFCNGCTSGHGLTGLARLARRSWVAVPAFMAAGAAAASLGGTSGWLPPDGATEAAAPRWPAAAAVAAGGAAALLLLAGAAARLCGRGAEARWAVVLAELTSGLAFGCGLVVSGMARPSKVAAFLDLRSGAWDPSLAFVMAAALLLTFPFFQILEGCTSVRPVLEESFELPLACKAPDGHLVLGAVAFGVGWGVCGACPGPIWVLLLPRLSLEVAMLTLGMLAGAGVWVAWSRGAGPCRAPAPAGAPGQSKAADDVEAVPERARFIPEREPEAELAGGGSIVRAVDASCE